MRALVYARPRGLLYAGSEDHAPSADVERERAARVDAVHHLRVELAELDERAVVLEPRRDRRAVLSLRAAI